MKNINLNGKYANSRVAMVDDEDFEWLNSKKWCVTKDGYVVTGVVLGRKSNGRFKTQTVLMHRVVANAPSDKVVDHEDGNRLNNQSHNLRNCTQQENTFNSVKSRNNSSGYIGVHWDREKDAWVASLTQNRKSIYIGHFKTAIEAAIVRNYYASTIRGEFVSLSHIDMQDNDQRLIVSRWEETKHLRSCNSSGYRGVFWRSSGGKWEAMIKKDGKLMSLGRFTDKTSAAEAYNIKAIELFGGRAILNPIRSASL